jgi:hypothetical protein
MVDTSKVYCCIQENRNPNVEPANLTVFRLGIKPTGRAYQTKLDRNELMKMLTAQMPSIAWHKSNADIREIWCKTDDDDIKLALILIIDSMGITRKDE